MNDTPFCMHQVSAAVNVQGHTAHHSLQESVHTLRQPPVLSSTMLQLQLITCR